MLIKPISLVIAYIFPIILFIIFKYQKSSTANSIVKSVVIMSIQLSISVFFLTFVFYMDNMIITFAYLVIMIIFSFKTLKNRISNNYNFKLQSMTSVVIAAFTTLIIMLLVLSLSGNVLLPRIIIPLFGMLLGNITTATVLASNEICNILTNKRHFIENLTNLGVPAKTALNEQLKTFVAIALTPTLTSMLNIGFVSLPGMMTGQILAGELPVNAISYQILIMIFILTGSSISILSLKYFVVNAALNDRNQLY